MKGIVLYSIVPVRTEAREGAEQETQLLFGELVTIVEEQERWLRIENEVDGETGWVDRKMITPLQDDEYEACRKAIAETTAMVAMPMAYAVSQHNQQTIPLTAGTRLPHFEAPAGAGQPARFEVLGVPFAIEPSMVLPAPLSLSRDSLLSVTRFFLNTPYLWGGKNALGIDCSGFTQVIFSLLGIRLPRNASQQALEGCEVESLEKAEAGDLCFFGHDSKVTHVGILLTADTLIHCSGRVKVEKIDPQGIVSSETGEHTHRLLTIRRLST